MNFSAISADGLISYILASVVFLITLLSSIHEMKDAIGDTKYGPRITEISEKMRRRLFSIIERGYELRFVSLFVSLALLVSLVSPVSALLEIEESVVKRSCDGLERAHALAVDLSAETCKDVAKQSALSYVNDKFGRKQNHLLQIAMWPLVATLYGFVISWFFGRMRKTPDEKFSTILERSTHIYHVFHGLVAFVAFLIGKLQDSIGT